MCDLEAGYTTVVGPAGYLEEVAGQWPGLISPLQGVGDPQLRTLGGRDHTYADPHCPGVLVARHSPVLGGLVADHLDRVIGRSMPHVDVVSEPGYWLRPAGGGSSAGGSAGGGPAGVGAAGVSVVPANLGRVTVRPPAGVGPAAGLPAAVRGRVAVIDTGDGTPGASVTDFTLGPDPTGVPAVDVHGHGSAVCELIRARNPSATVEALRVCSAGLAASVELYLALVYALWPRDRYGVVNVSLSTQLSGSCATPLGKTITAVAQWCTGNRGGLDVHLVTAAGNRPQKFGYPAAVPGAVVVEALDWNGQPAAYNTPLPPGLATAQASGGQDTPGDSLGTVTVGGSSEDLVGTSFAAALVSADLAR